MDKKALRSEIRAKIRNMDASYRADSDEGMLKNIISLPEYQKAETVFAYFSIRGEADTHKIIEHAVKNGKRVALPVVLGNGIMEFALATGNMREGMSFEIPEPDETAPRVEPDSGDIIIVPALCFDKNGYRLGQGGGFYDRYLERHSDIFSVGLCREKLYMQEVPRERFDMRVSCVVTEKKTARP